MAPLLIMGVAGCGKTTLGHALAARHRLRFIDGDDLHSPAARAQMAAGIALTDADRLPWLDRVAAAFTAPDSRAGPRAVPRADIIACSALKRAYRDRLRTAVPGLTFVYLAIDAETAAARLTARPGHYFAPALLDSQFATLEPPGPDEPDVRTLDATLPLAQLLLAIAAPPR